MPPSTRIHGCNCFHNKPFRTTIILIDQNLLILLREIMSQRIQSAPAAATSLHPASGTHSLTHFTYRLPGNLPDSRNTFATAKHSSIPLPGNTTHECNVALGGDGDGGRRWDRELAVMRLDNLDGVANLDGVSPLFLTCSYVLKMAAVICVACMLWV